MMPKTFWRDMPTTAFQNCDDWIAVLPLAAIEQHGPHLPLGVDSIIAEGMVERAAKALPAGLPATFLPVQQIGKSNEHDRFPGTLTLDWETSVNTLLDIGNSVARTGLRKLVLITSHGGNLAPMEIAARALRSQQNMLVVTTSWGRLGDWQTIYDYSGPMVDIHGGLSETSVMLGLRPDLVDMAAARDFTSAQTGLAENNTHLGFHSMNANIAWQAQDLNPAGVVGDAAGADAALGARDIASSVSGFCRLVREIHDMPAPKAVK